MPIQTLHLRSNVQGKEPVAGSAVGQLPVGSIGINFNSAEPFLTIQDSAGAIRRIAGIKVDASAPASPTAGEAWLDTTITAKPVFKIHNGTAWVVAGGSGVSGSGTAPTAPIQGDLWVDTSVPGSPVLKVYNGTTWVVVTPDATTAVKGVVQLADAAAVTAGTAGRAVTADQLKATNDNISAASVWTRTGTDLGPTTAGDSVTTTGAIKGSDLTTTNVVSAAVLATDATGKIIAGTPGGGASVETGATPPAGPTAGDLWFNTNDGRLYVWYVDADSGQWIDASPDSPASPPPPDLWERTGTTLSPKTAGDSLDMGSLKVAGSAPASSVNLDSSGRLLVGTSTARTGFFGSSAGQIQLETAVSPPILGIVSNSNDIGQAYLALAKSRGTTVGSNTVVQSGDYCGTLSFQGADGDQLVECARIDGVVDGTPGNNDMPGMLCFSTTADGSNIAAERFRVNSNGQLCINTTTATTGIGHRVFIEDGSTYAPMGVNNTAGGTGSSNNIVIYRAGTQVGSITTTNVATAYNTSSDYRLKENIVPLAGAADRLNQLQVHRFNFIADPTTTVDGFIAHEAQAVVPECVTGKKDAVDDDGNPVYQGIDQSKLVPLLTAALQEALAKIEALETRIAALEVTP